MNFHSTYLGFRADALHPRLYAAARIRGLRTRQNVGNDKVGNLPHTFSSFLTRRSRHERLLGKSTTKKRRVRRYFLLFLRFLRIFVVDFHCFWESLTTT